jgi:putative transposase
MDFVSDRIFDGRPFRILTIVDCHTREALSLTPRANFRAFQVTEALDALVKLRGRPKSLRVDNGPEFAGRMLDQWAYLNGVEIDFSRPGKPTDTDVVEKPFHAGAGIFFLDRDLVGAVARHRAVKSAYASSAFSTCTRSAARLAGML